MTKADSDATIARLRKAHAIATHNDKALRKIVAARNATIAELQTTGRDLAAAHATLTRDLAKRDATIEQLRAEIAALDRGREWERIVDDRDATIAEQSQIISEHIVARDAMIDALYAAAGPRQFNLIAKPARD